jgi:hypothetical protein
MVGFPGWSSLAAPIVPSFEAVPRPMSAVGRAGVGGLLLQVLALERVSPRENAT